MLTLLAAAAAAAVQTAPSAAVPSYRPHFIDFEAGEARCDGRVVATLTTVRPFTETARIGATSPRAVIMEFSLDRDGRPLGITQKLAEGSPPYSFVPIGDLAPALSLWRFAGGRVGGRCSLTFTPRTQPVDEATEVDLFRVAALRTPSAIAQRDVLARLRKIDCGGQRPPQTLLRAFPDKSRLTREPGVPAYSVVGFDIDAEGVPTRVEIVTSSGNAGFDRAAVDAAGRTRFAGGAPRTRCTVPMLLGVGDPIDAPPAPDRASFKPAGSNCPDQIKWTRPFALQYPDGFRRRGIEGWAIIGFDLAPWGAPGEVKVLASEPAEAFGAQARQLVTVARAEASPSGARGCVVKVVFRMPDADDRSSEAQAAGF